MAVIQCVFILKNENGTPFVSIELLEPWTSKLRELTTNILTNIGTSFVFNKDNGFRIDLENVKKCAAALKLCDFKIVNEIPDKLLTHLHQTYAKISNLHEKVGDYIWSKLKPFQKEAVEFGVNRKKVYIADEMGLGKTLESIAICKYYEEHWPCLIICPSILKYTWGKELRKWLQLQDDDILIANSSSCIKKTAVSHKFLIITYGLIHRETWLLHLTRNLYSVVVLDEAHYIKSRKSKRSNAAVKLTQQAAIRILLSGTPFCYPAGLYPQLSALYPEIYPSFFNPNDVIDNNTFASRYCSPVQRRNNNGFEWVYNGYDNQTELNTLVSSFMIRRRKEQVLAELPTKLRTCVVLEPLKPDEQSHITSLLTDKEDRFSFMESFRLTCSYKTEQVLIFLKDYVISNLMKQNPKLCVLIFCHHSAMREALEKVLHSTKISHFSIHGGTSDKQRREFEHDFQNSNKYKIGILSITAACAGLTLTRASVVIFTEILFGPDMMFQAEDRVHRIGQASNVNIIYLLQPNTTDDINWRLIKKKEKEVSRIIDGTPSVVNAVNLQSHNTPALDQTINTRKKFVTKRMKFNEEQKAQNGQLLPEINC